MKLQPIKPQPNTERDNPVQAREERVIDYLRAAIFDGSCGLADVPELIKRVIREDLWRRRVLPGTGETVVFSRFEAFLHTSPPEGLGTDYKTLHRLCADDVETVDLLEQTKRSRNRGGDRRSAAFKDDNVNFERTNQGNSLEYALKRLRRHRPDLHGQIIEGRLSVNQAMIRAGYRKPPMKISRALHETAAALKSVFAPKQLEELIALLRQPD